MKVNSILVPIRNKSFFKSIQLKQRYNFCFKRDMLHRLLNIVDRILIKDIPRPREKILNNQFIPQNKVLKFTGTAGLNIHLLIYSYVG